MQDLKSVVYNCHAYIKECLEDKWAIQRVLEWWVMEVQKP
jgi:hypothetical protein